MKYFCTACRVQIKRKSSVGWAEHAKGAKHIQAMNIMRPLRKKDPFLDFISSMHSRSLITSKEMSEVQRKYLPQQTKEEIKVILRNIFS